MTEQTRGWDLILIFFRKSPLGVLYSTTSVGGSYLMANRRTTRESSMRPTHRHRGSYSWHTSSLRSILDGERFSSLSPFLCPLPHLLSPHPLHPFLSYLLIFLHIYTLFLHLYLLYLLSLTLRHSTHLTRDHWTIWILWEYHHPPMEINERFRW